MLLINQCLSSTFFHVFNTINLPSESLLIRVLCHVSGFRINRLLVLTSFYAAPFPRYAIFALKGASTMATNTKTTPIVGPAAKYGFGRTLTRREESLSKSLSSWKVGGNPNSCRTAKSLGVPCSSSMSVHSFQIRPASLLLTSILRSSTTNISILSHNPLSMFQFS